MAVDVVTGLQDCSVYEGQGACGAENSSDLVVLMFRRVEDLGVREAKQVKLCGGRFSRH